jgi:hypothetical protein
VMPMDLGPKPRRGRPLPCSATRTPMLKASCPGVSAGVIWAANISRGPTAGVANICCNGCMVSRQSSYASNFYPLLLRLELFSPLESQAGRH